MLTLAWPITGCVSFSKSFDFFLVDWPLDYKCQNPIQLPKKINHVKAMLGQGHLLAYIKMSRGIFGSGVA